MFVLNQEFEERFEKFVKDCEIERFINEACDSSEEDSELLESDSSDSIYWTPTEVTDESLISSLPLTPPASPVLHAEDFLDEVIEQTGNHLSIREPVWFNTEGKEIVRLERELANAANNN